MERTELVHAGCDRTANWYRLMSSVFSSEARRQILSDAQEETPDVGIGQGKDLAPHQLGCRVNVSRGRRHGV